MAGVAQSVEFQIVALAVVGSSPIARPKRKDKGMQECILFFIYTLSGISYTVSELHLESYPVSEL